MPNDSLLIPSVSSQAGGSIGTQKSKGSFKYSTLYIQTPSAEHSAATTTGMTSRAITRHGSFQEDTSNDRSKSDGASSPSECGSQHEYNSLATGKKSLACYNNLGYLDGRLADHNTRAKEQREKESDETSGQSVDASGAVLVWDSGEQCEGGFNGQPDGAADEN